MNGKSFRFALDPAKPIGELAFPEFYDVKVTSQCSGGCRYCYQSSDAGACHAPGIVGRFRRFFEPMSGNERPFQIAFGGGEPTSHPEFCALIQACSELGITPNYTTNGSWAQSCDRDKVMSATLEFCGGVAVSTHQHLEHQWRSTVELLLANGVHTNLHCIIGDRSSIDVFSKLYREFSGRVRYFVLLPLAAQGRSTTAFTDWGYLSSSINGSPKDVAFGAGFHQYLKSDHGRFSVSIYEPESMSAYLDLETMRVFKSSFSSEERIIGNQRHAS